MASGLYMTAVPIETIHGDHLGRPDASFVDPKGLVEPASLAGRFPGMTSFRLIVSALGGLFAALTGVWLLVALLRRRSATPRSSTLSAT